MNPKLRFELQKKIVAIIRNWPKLSHFLETGDTNGHPQYLITQILDAVEETLKGPPDKGCS